MLRLRGVGAALEATPLSMTVFLGVDRGSNGRLVSFAPTELGLRAWVSHGLRRGLQSFAASRLRLIRCYAPPILRRGV